MKSKRKNGVFYTPSVLADYLINPFIESGSSSILDPAYGDGALLLSAERAMNTQKTTFVRNLYGCDILPLNGLLKHLPEANLQKLDFFEYPVSRKHDLILTNPPYVRHHYQDNKKISIYRENLECLDILGNKADLWAFFLIKCANHLKVGGSIGAILPWSFLQADYAQPLRKWLRGVFGQIKVLALTEKYFKDAQERVVLVWLTNYGFKCSKVSVGFSKQLSEKISFTSISNTKWDSNKVQPNSGITTDEIVRKIKDLGFFEISKYATVRIGVVTGAVTYFIQPISKATSDGFTRKDMVPIMSSVKDLINYLQHGTRHLKRLLLFKTVNKKTRLYIKFGTENKYDKRRHCQLRKPWYAVRVGKTPDAFFPYRVSKWPFLVFNKSKIQCTNSIHRIYFKKLTPTQRKWFSLSISSAFSQFSIENNSKTYGRGMLKIEPTAFNHALAIVKNDRNIDKVYKEFQSLIVSNKRETAMLFATEFISKTLNIGTDFSNEVINAVIQLQKNRGS
jgi:adenine-specific DNA-methyltransferase